MNVLLYDLIGALRWNLQHEVEVCPDAYKANAAALARLEAADYRGRMLTLETDAERERLTRRWLKAYRP